MRGRVRSEGAENQENQEEERPYSKLAVRCGTERLSRMEVKLFCFFSFLFFSLVLPAPDHFSFPLWEPGYSLLSVFVHFFFAFVLFRDLFACVRSFCDTCWDLLAQITKEWTFFWSPLYICFAFLYPFLFVWGGCYLKIKFFFSTVM